MTTKNLNGGAPQHPEDTQRDAGAKAVTLGELERSGVTLGELERSGVTLAEISHTKEDSHGK